MAKPSRTSLFAAAARWDAASVAANLALAPELVKVTDPQGRTALHRACAVKPGGNPQLAEPDGIRTVTTLLEAGAELEREVPMNEDEGDFRATPLWYAVARGKTCRWSGSFCSVAQTQAIRFGRQYGATMIFYVAPC